MGNEITPTTEGVEEAIEELENEKAVDNEEETTEEEVEPKTETEEDDETEQPSDDEVTVDSLLQELVANKYELSDELKEKAEKAGINVDSLELAGIKDKTRSEGIINDMYESVGGKEEFEAMQKWATEGGLSEAEAKEFNDGIVSENRGMFVKGLYAMYKGANPTESTEVEKPAEQKKSRVSGKSQPQQSIHKGYKSLRDMQEAISYMRKNPNDSDAQRTYDTKMKYSGGLLKR